VNATTTIINGGGSLTVTESGGAHVNTMALYTINLTNAVTFTETEGTIAAPSVVPVTVNAATDNSVITLNYGSGARTTLTSTTLSATNNTVLNVASVAGLATGQFVMDLTNPGAIPPGTTIIATTGIVGNQVVLSAGVSQNALAGDTLAFMGSNSGGAINATLGNGNNIVNAAVSATLLGAVSAVSVTNGLAGGSGNLTYNDTATYVLKTSTAIQANGQTVIANIPSITDLPFFNIVNFDEIRKVNKSELQIVM
jgi:hypothetical protein